MHCRRIVQKDGPNKGRPFYTCSKGMNNPCKFFQWGDENVEDVHNDTFRERNKQMYTRKQSEQHENRQVKSRVTSRKRKCGICGTEGSYFIVWNFSSWRVVFALRYAIY